MVLAVEATRKQDTLVTDRFEINPGRIDIGRQLVICKQREADMPANLLQVFESRNLDTVRDRHVARRTPDGIGFLDVADLVAVVDGIARRIQVVRASPFAEQFTAGIDVRGDNRILLPL